MQRNVQLAQTRDNKGFTVHVGSTYIGYLVIGEKNVSEEFVAKLQQPSNMAALLAKAELKPFEKKEADVSDAQAVLDALSAETDAALTDALAEQDVELQEAS